MCVLFASFFKNTEEAAVGSNSPPFVEGQVHVEGAGQILASSYSNSPLLSLAAAAAVANAER